MARKSLFTTAVVRKAAKVEFRKAGFSVHEGHLSEIMDLKRALYKVEGRALSAKERKALKKSNARKIVLARKALFTTLEKYGYKSLAEAKMAARATGCFDKA